MNLRNIRFQIEPRYITVLLVIVGMLLRLITYFRRPFLWGDETTRVAGINGFSYSEIFNFGHNIKTQIHDPYFFLCVQKFLVTLLGQDLYAIRLLPLLCSLISVWLFAKLKDWIAPSWEGMLALFFFALSTQLTQFAAVFNTYPSDVMTVLCLWLLFKNMLVSRLTFSKVIVYCLWGTAAIWFALPSAFILAAMGIALITKEILEKNKQKIIPILAICLVWLLNFVFYYFYALRYFSTDESARSRWILDFMPRGQGITTAVRWTGQHVYAMFNHPANILPAAGLFCFVIGCVALARKN